MIRIAATLCFYVTLLCPVFCLADEAGPCSGDAQTDARNCEAMTIGAVVVKSVIDTSPLRSWLPALDGLLPPAPSAVGPPRRVTPAVWNRAASRPPNASTRHALLQVFLF